MSSAKKIGHPSPRRFRIRRHPRDFSPWTITDRSRPAWIKHVDSLADALALMDENLRQDHGR